MGFNEAWEVAKNVPGWYLEQEARLLYDSAKKASTGIGLLEIGCYAGRSTRILAEATKETESTLWIVDRFFHENPLPDVPDPKAIVTAVLLDSGCDHVIVESAVEALPQHAIPWMVDFIHIDDSHTEHDLAIDGVKIIPRLRNGGLLAFHDYIPEWPDVVEFVDSIRSGFNEIGRAGGCIVLEKK